MVINNDLTQCSVVKNENKGGNPHDAMAKKNLLFWKKKRGGKTLLNCTILYVPASRLSLSWQAWDGGTHTGLIAPVALRVNIGFPYPGKLDIVRNKI